MPPPTTLVLVVDDEPALRGLLRRLLEAWGYLVCEAATVDSALEVLRTHPVDAVVLDVRLPDQKMPKRSGLDVLAFLRLHDRFLTLPVLILTGFALSEEERRLIEKHRARILEKPAGYGRLRRALGEMTGRAAAPDEG